MKYNRSTQGSLRQGDAVPESCRVVSLDGQSRSVLDYGRPGVPLVVYAGSYT